MYIYVYIYIYITWHRSLIPSVRFLQCDASSQHGREFEACVVLSIAKEVLARCFRTAHELIVRRTFFMAVYIYIYIYIYIYTNVYVYIYIQNHR